MKIFKDDTKNSIKAWMDIVPDAEKIDMVEEMVLQRQLIATLSKTLETVQRERDEAKTKSSDLEAKYLAKEESLSKQIENLIAQLNEKSREIHGSTLSGISGTSGYSSRAIPLSALLGPQLTEPILTPNICKNCGKPIPGRWCTPTGLCPECERLHNTPPDKPLE